MAASTTPHARMTHGYLRWIGVIGIADTFGYRLPVRPRAHAAAKAAV
jgi:hypothetical protein